MNRFLFQSVSVVRREIAFGSRGLVTCCAGFNKKTFGFTTQEPKVIFTCFETLLSNLLLMLLPMHPVRNFLWYSKNGIFKMQEPIFTIFLDFSKTVKNVSLKIRFVFLMISSRKMKGTCLKMNENPQV